MTECMRGFRFRCVACICSAKLGMEWFSGVGLGKLSLRVWFRVQGGRFMT